jgi:hypothetical protein
MPLSEIIEEAFDFQSCFLALLSWILCHLPDFGRIFCVCLDYHEGAMPICGRHFNRELDRWCFSSVTTAEREGFIRWPSARFLVTWSFALWFFFFHCSGFS